MFSLTPEQKILVDAIQEVRVKEAQNESRTPPQPVIEIWYTNYHKYMQEQDDRKADIFLKMGVFDRLLHSDERFSEAFCKSFPDAAQYNVSKKELIYVLSAKAMQGCSIL